MNYQPYSGGGPMGSFFRDTPVVANIILINVVLLLLTWTASNVWGIDLVSILGLYFPTSALFRPWQPLTHMFMHAGITHLFFNMFAFWMFGRVLESYWGSKRFAIYYLITGLGAMACHLGVVGFEMWRVERAANAFLADGTPLAFQTFVQEFFPQYFGQVWDKGLGDWMNHPDSRELFIRCQALLGSLLELGRDVPMVGASGAVYGVLLAYGMSFPNSQILLLIPPIPIRAKWFVIIYAALELYLGISQPGSSVAHFAHLGGMLFGFILIRVWRRHVQR